MIKSVTITNYLGESMELELTRPDKSGIYIKKIDGLGPVNAQVNLTELSSADGSVYNSSRLNSRNIVMTLGLMFNPMIEDSRHLLYRMFPLKKEVRVDVLTDRRALYTIGYVEKNEPDIFNKEETQQISILCTSPFWNFPIPYEAKYYYAEKGFEFEFWNPKSEGASITDKEIEFGTITNLEEVDVINPGDNDCGMVIDIICTNDFVISSYPSDDYWFTLTNLQTSEQIKVIFSRLPSSILSPFGVVRVGDTIRISTVKGDRYASYVRNGSQYNIINVLGRNIDWIQIHPGHNTFSAGYSVHVPAYEKPFALSFTYNIQYIGV